ncbi:MAG: hypothetical protein IKI84_05640 [Clostridia bacterium]|nr:hypothetical protein [Clostridia bacterium]
MDVLLGYEIKYNRLEVTVKRLQEYRRRKDRNRLAEAEKALRKYPHSFKIVIESAALYRAFGFDSGDKPLFSGSTLPSGQGDKARDTLIKAKDPAAFFAASPGYVESDIRPISRIEGASGHDDMGATAIDGVEHAVRQFDNEELTALWRSITEQEGPHE